MTLAVRRVGQLAMLDMDMLTASLQSVRRSLNGRK